jgi:hypothetical protein
VSQEFHYLTDPFRYPSGWQNWGPKLPAAAQQVLRIPWVYIDGGAGAAYGGSALSYAGDGPQEAPAQWVISVTSDPGLNLAKRLFPKLIARYFKYSKSASGKS